MQFKPKTEKELTEEKLFPPGIYPFEVIEAKETISKAGNEMIVMNLRVFHGGRTQFVTDFLMESTGYKLRHAAVMMGLEKAYDSGNLIASDFEGKEGWAKLKISTDKTGQYPAKNVVVDYVRPPVEAGSARDAKAASAGLDEDEIPF